MQKKFNQTSTQTIKTCWLTKWFLQLPLIFLLLISSFSYAQTPPSNYWDGNPADWQTLLSTSNYLKINNPRADLMNNSTDQTLASGAKDVNDFPLWHWSYATNDKTDIRNAVIVLLEGNVVRFAADRFAQNGDAEIGIWLLKSPVSTNEDGTFNGQHSNGDVLITSKFTEGGGQATITVRTWQNGALSSESNPPSGYAAVNTSGKDVPAVFQPFTSKNAGNDPDAGAANRYPIGAFFEGTLDLDDIGQSCFTRFLFETSQSQSTNEALGDFLVGGFNTKPDAPTPANAEKCYDGNVATASADCGSNNGTVVYYDGEGNVVSSENVSRTAVGVSTFYAACVVNGCESDRVPITVTINALPSVDGVITEGENDNSIDDGVSKLDDDVYQIRISKTAVANLSASASGGSGSYTTYLWEELDGDAATSFSTSGATAVFTVTSTTGLNTTTGYRFRVTLTDSKGCTATDIVTIVPTGNAPACNIVGPPTVCAGSASNSYTLDADHPANGADELDPDFNYVWSISGDGTINDADVNTGTLSGVNSIVVTAGSSAGSYIVTLTITGKDNNLLGTITCTKSTNVNLVAPTSSKTEVSCNGFSDGSMTAVGAGGTGPYSYTISPAGDPANTSGASSGIFTGLAAGTYTVTATDANGCWGTTQQTINQPDALSCSLTAPATAPACGSSGNTVSGTISGGTPAYSCSASFDAAATSAGWLVTNCAVTGSGISITYTAGSNGPAVLTVRVTDANNCVSECTVNLSCTTVGHGCTPGFWKSPKGLKYWDASSDAVAQRAGFKTSDNFFTFLEITSYCGLNSSLTMRQAIELGGGGCAALARHGVAALLNAATLPDYPLPAGVTSYEGLKDAIEAAFENGCNCGPLATELAANNELDHSNCGQVLTQAINSITAIETPITSKDLKVSAFPNPYTHQINFRFMAPQSGKAQLEIFDLMGRKLDVLYNANLEAGIEKNILYNVPSSRMIPMIYRLTIGDKAIHGTVLPNKQ